MVIQLQVKRFFQLKQEPQLLVKQSFQQFGQHKLFFIFTLPLFFRPQQKPLLTLSLPFIRLWVFLLLHRHT